MTFQSFNINEEYLPITHKSCALLFSYSRNVISYLNNQKIITFNLEKCYNYKK